MMMIVVISIQNGMGTHIHTVYSLPLNQIWLEAFTGTGNEFSHGPLFTIRDDDEGVLNQILRTSFLWQPPSTATASNIIIPPPIKILLSVHHMWCWCASNSFTHSSIQPFRGDFMFHSSCHIVCSSASVDRKVNYCFDTCFWLNLNDWIMWTHFLLHWLDGVGRYVGPRIERYY